MTINKKSKQLQDLHLFVKSLPDPVEYELQFHPPRKWRFDFAFVEKKVAVEYEGGIFRKGGGFHQSIKVMIDNMDKYNIAALDGWKVLRFCAKQVQTDTAFKMIETALYPAK